MRNFRFILLGFVILLSAFCNHQDQGKNTRSPGNDPALKIEQVDGVKHIYNTIHPSGGSITLELETLIEISSNKIPSDTQAFFDAAAKDSKQDLFLLDRRASRIYKLIPSGKFEKSFLKKGEGPAETRGTVLSFKVSDPNIWASYVTEFCRFDLDGNFIEKKLFKRQYGLLEHVDEKRFITSYDTYEGKVKTGQVCALMDTDENLLMKLYERRNPDIGYSSIKLEKKDFLFVSSTSPRLCYTYNPFNKLGYFFYNFDYSIHLVGLDGKVDRIIHKESKPVEITEADFERILAGFKRMGWPQHYLDAYKKNPPEKFLPVIRKICLLPRGYFAVIRSLNYEQDEFDIFDPEGRFIYIIKQGDQTPDLWDVYFFKDSIGVIIHEDEVDVFKEYKVKNLPHIYPI
ncbi:MAG: hypothetical protein QG657_4518 [Acidobacteriota bacterium]|nr:hypothetical protein [Acidobacteriota bacterium]